jgi:hypothetical protein
VDRAEQRKLPLVAALGFDEGLGLLACAPYLAVHNNRLERARKEATLRLQSASLESLDAPELRGLERAQHAQLQTEQHIE